MTEQRKLLSTKEAAEYCGFKLSYFRKLMMRRVIPMYKPCGKLCFFKKEDLDAFLTGVRISSQEEIAEEADRYLTASHPKRKSRRKPTAILQAGSKQPFYSHQNQM